MGGVVVIGRLLHERMDTCLREFGGSKQSETVAIAVHSLGARRERSAPVDFWGEWLCSERGPLPNYENCDEA